MEAKIKLVRRFLPHAGASLFNLFPAKPSPSSGSPAHAAGQMDYITSALTAPRWRITNAARTVLSGRGALIGQDEILWHRWETRQQIESTNIDTPEASIWYKQR